MSATATYKLEDIPKKYIDPTTPKDIGEGARVSGKEWKISKDAFRVRTLGVKQLKSSNFKERELKKMQEDQYKSKLKELKGDKENARKEKLAALKKKREAKEEKERFERVAAKMTAKKVERLRKKEKRNKLLKER